MNRILAMAAIAITLAAGEDGPDCTEQVWIVAYTPQSSVGLLMSRMDGRWGIGPLQSWWLDFSNLYKNANTIGADGKYSHVAFAEARNALAERFPVCGGRLVDWGFGSLSRTTMTEHTKDTNWEAAEGGCDCGQVRYRMESRPLFVHCCHCRWCQRESGASFALNAMIESDRVTLVCGEPVMVHTPSNSGLGQDIARCPACHVALWSHYSGAGPVLRFVRVGTLDDPDRLPPDIHIFTASKQPWVQLPPGVPAVPEYYDREEHWPVESLARREAIRGQIEAHQEWLQRK